MGTPPTKEQRKAAKNMAKSQSGSGTMATKLQAVQAAQAAEPEQKTTEGAPKAPEVDIEASLSELREGLAETITEQDTAVEAIEAKTKGSLLGMVQGFLSTQAPALPAVEDVNNATQTEASDEQQDDNSKIAALEAKVTELSTLLNQINDWAHSTDGSMNLIQKALSDSKGLIGEIMAAKAEAANDAAFKKFDSGFRSKWSPRFDQLIDIVESIRTAVGQSDADIGEIRAHLPMMRELQRLKEGIQTGMQELLALREEIAKEKQELLQLRNEIYAARDEILAALKGGPVKVATTNGVSHAKPTAEPVVKTEEAVVEAKKSGPLFG